MRRVVVTGLGLVSPVGLDVKSSWNEAVAGRTGVQKITLFDSSPLSVHIAAEVKNFSSAHVLDSKEENRATRFCRFAVVASKEALVDSGLDYQNSNTERWGASIGVGLGALDYIESSAQILKEFGPKRISPFFLPYTIPNMAAGMTSKYFNLKGPNICTTTACASGTHGVGEAFQYIAKNMADVMVAGGAESAISPLGITSFQVMKALSRNEDPSKASRPFDLNRDGFVMGEGCGTVVLEELEHAKKRGAKIYAEIVGYGLSGDAYHITAPAPDGEGGKRCMEMAIKGGNVPKNEVDYINAHGTSTKMNDHFESIAIGNVFGDHAKAISVSSTKGVTGHCLGAAGGIEAVFSVLAIHHSLVPPTANLETPDPDCPLDYTPGQAKERKIRYALSNSFGFGGTNASIIFKKFS
jgi:3-oxoacyl-[acyl-carrier-protein] synthase II